MFSTYSHCRDRHRLQQEELAASVQVGRGALDHGGESHMTQQDRIDNIHQGAEEFLRTPEGAKMLRTSQPEVEERGQNGETAELEV